MRTSHHREEAERKNTRTLLQCRLPDRRLAPADQRAGADHGNTEAKAEVGNPRRVHWRQYKNNQREEEGVVETQQKQSWGGREFVARSEASAGYHDQPARREEETCLPELAELKITREI